MILDDRVVPMVEEIDQIIDALLDHDLIVSITRGHSHRGDNWWELWQKMIGLV